MKKNFYSPYVVSLFSAALLLSGCSKTEEPTANTAPAAAVPAAEPPKAPEVKAALDSAVAQTPKPPEPQAATTPSTAVADASQKGQTLLERIKALIADKKYPEALAAISEASSTSLTADQQKLLEQLKAQAQSAVTKQSTDQGLKAVGGLLDRKK